MKNLKRNIASLGIIIVFVLMVIFFAVSSRSFLRVENLINVLRQVVTTGVITIGASMVIITGNIDLSAGSVVGLSAVSAAWLMVAGVHPVLASVLVLLIGVVCGLLNGLFVARIRLPAFVVTLATQLVFRGLAFIITGGLAIYGFTPAFKVLGQGFLGPIPIPVIIMAVMFAIGFVITEKTRFGRYIYGIGGNEEAARLSGISPGRIKMMVYAFAGALGAMAGLIVLSRVNSGNPNLGVGYETDIISACVIGGVSITGGKGKIAGVIVGVLFLGVLTNGLILLNVNEFVQMVVKGAVLLFAVTFDVISQRQKAKMIVTVAE